MDPSVLLLVQAAAAGSALAYAYKALSSRGLFRWTTTGFWAWASLSFFLFLVPLYNAFAVDTTFHANYLVTLSSTEGEPRALWVALVSVVGIITFFTVYVQRPLVPVSWRMKKTAEGQEISEPMWVVLWACVTVGLLSLVIYRATSSPLESAAELSGGRFNGGATGYQVQAHMLLFVPVLILCSSPRRGVRWTGVILAAIYIGISSLDPWGRYLAVSMVLALSLLFTARSGRRWPPVAILVAAVVLATVLQIRGHNSFSSATDFVQLVQQVPSQLPSTLGNQGNVGMLNTFYLQSYVNDRVVGYDFGIPLVNYVGTGFLPDKFFPWKYFMVDWLHARQYSHLDPYYVFRLSIQKPTLLGSFYEDGSIVGVVLLCMLAGVCSRWVDSMLDKGAPLLARATGLTWLSVFWMVWASDDWWGVQILGSLAIPTLLMWLVSPGRISVRLRRRETQSWGRGLTRPSTVVTVDETEPVRSPARAGRTGV